MEAFPHAIANIKMNTPEEFLVMLCTLTLALKQVLLKPVVITTSLGSASIPLNNSSKLILTGVGRLATHGNAHAV